LLEDLDGISDAFLRLLGSPLCLVQEPQIKTSLGQNAVSSNFFCNLDRFLEVLFGLGTGGGNVSQYKCYILSG